MNGYFVGRPKNWKDYYELAAKQCAEILGATDNPHELDPSYENIWSTVNHLEYNKYNENLFEVAFGEGQNGDVGATMGYNLNRGVFNTTQGMGGQDMRLLLLTIFIHLIRQTPVGMLLVFSRNISMRMEK